MVRAELRIICVDLRMVRAELRTLRAEIWVVHISGSILQNEIRTVPYLDMGRLGLLNPCPPGCTRGYGNVALRAGDRGIPPYSSSIIPSNFALLVAFM
jgi:hypothetical protein